MVRSSILFSRLRTGARRFRPALISSNVILVPVSRHNQIVGFRPAGIDAFEILKATGFHSRLMQESTITYPP